MHSKNTTLVKQFQNLIENRSNRGKNDKFHFPDLVETFQLNGGVRLVLRAQSFPHRMQRIGMILTSLHDTYANLYCFFTRGTAQEQAVYDRSTCTH